MHEAGDRKFGVMICGHGSRSKSAVTEFAEKLEQTVIETVESGQMTKDLALLIGPDQDWLTTEGFLEAVATNLERAMA